MSCSSRQFLLLINQLLSTYLGNKKTRNSDVVSTGEICWELTLCPLNSDHVLSFQTRVSKEANANGLNSQWMTITESQYHVLNNVGMKQTQTWKQFFGALHVLQYVRHRSVAWSLFGAQHVCYNISASLCCLIIPTWLCCSKLFLSLQ